MYKNFKISLKILIGFGVVILLNLLLLIISLLSINKIGNLTNDMYESSMILTNGSIQIISEFNNIGKEMWQAMVYENIENSNNSINESLNTVDILVDKMSSVFMGEEDYINGFKNAIKDTSKIRKNVVNAAESGDYDTATSILKNEYVPSFEKTYSYAKDLYNKATDKATEFNNNAISTKNRVLFILIAILIIAVIYTLIITKITSKSIITPIKEVSNALEEISKGNLKITVKYKSKDELGKMSDCIRNTIKTLTSNINEVKYMLDEISNGNLNLKLDTEFKGDFVEVQNSLNTIIQSLNSTIGQINESAEQVSSGSEQIASGSQLLAQGATEQADSIQRLLLTVSQISDKAEENANGSENANLLIKSLKNKIIENNKQMNDMINAMSKINDSSKKIEEISKLIEYITFQINILAINAAIESSHAGSSGKGFAVVADEIRSLAIKSSQASKNTSELIENSIEQIKEGTEIANITSESLHNITHEINNIVNIIDTISDSSNKQADSVIQVTKGIEKISDVVQTNSATSQQSAAASEQLNSQVHNLKQLVNRFQFKDTNNTKIFPSNFLGDKKY